MANRYANLPGAAKIKDTYDRINQGFDLVEQDVDQLRADLDQEIADREAAVEYVDQRVDNIIVGGGPDKDPELVDIRNLDPSYTPQREINVAGDVTRDMQAQFAAHKAETTQDYTVTLYVSTTGNDANDGLSAGSPFATLQKAFDTIAENSYRANIGTWKIKLAAGTYNEQAKLSAGLRTKNRIEIIGEVDENNIPTVIFDGGSGARLYGMQFSDYAFVKVQDVKFQNFTGNSGQGIYCQHFCNLWTVNVHAYNCGFAGINANVLSRLYVQGGIIDSCRIGIRVYSGSVATIGYQAGGDINNGTVIKNCTEAGVKFYNQCSGHVDYSTIEGNIVGIDIINQSRVHVMGNDIKNNTRGVKVSIASTWYDNNNTYTSNTIDKENLTYSVELGNQNKRTFLKSHTDLTKVSHTGTTAETDLKNNYTIPAKTFGDVGRKLRIRASGTFAGAGTKTVRVRFDTGLVTGFTSVSGSTKSWQIEVDVWANGYTSQKVFGRWREGNSAYDNLYVDRTLDMNSSRVVKLTGELSDPTATIDVEIFEIEEVL